MGYTGGDAAAEPPTYQSVCARNNTYTEAVRLELDASVLTYEQLVRAFLNDPRAQRVLQDGAQAVSPLFARAQTRVALWAQDELQMATAQRVLAEAGRLRSIPLLRASKWFDAEDEHQHFIRDEKVRRRGKSRIKCRTSAHLKLGTSSTSDDVLLCVGLTYKLSG